MASGLLSTSSCSCFNIPVSLKMSRFICKLIAPPSISRVSPRRAALRIASDCVDVLVNARRVQLLLFASSMAADAVFET